MDCCCSVTQSCLFMISWTAACQASLSFTIPQSLLKLMSIEWEIAIQPSCPLLSPYPPVFSSFPPLGSFPVSQFFTSGDQSIGASTSASVLPMNIPSWFPSGLTSLISLLSKGLSRVFNSTVQKHQFFSAQPSLWPNSHSYMTTGKIIALTILTFVSKIMYLLFNTLTRFVIGVLYSPW